MSVIVLNKRPKKKSRFIQGRGVKAPKSVEWEARRSIDRLMNPVYDELEKWAERFVVDFNYNRITAKEAALQLRNYQYSFEDYLNTNAETLAKNWVDSVNRINKVKNEKEMAKSLGIDAARILEEQDVKETLDIMLIESQELIRTIPYNLVGKVSQRVLQTFKGEAMPEGRTLLEQIQHEFGLSYDRAKVIARDQTSKLNGNLNAVRQMGLGIEEYIWQTAGDERVVGRPGGLYPRGNRMHGNHWERQGKRFKWTEPPADGHPGEAIQCLTGDVQIMFPDGAKKLFRRRYKGIVYTITTKSGITLTATPNHPVLTKNGWLPVNALNKGDNLIKHVGYSESIGKINNNKFYPTFKQVWDSFNQPIRSRRGSKLNFHGDGSDENIDIKNIDCFLPKSRISNINEFLGNSKNTVPVKVIRKYLRNWDIDFIVNRFHYDPIVDIKEKKYDNYVYNCETTAGYYIANGIVNHNCRCYADPIIDLKKIRSLYV